MAKILIVEDEAKIARFLELELKHEGYEVTFAADGRTGLEKALDPGVDLILLDIMLPGLSGIEVCRRVRKAAHKRTFQRKNTHYCGTPLLQRSTAFDRSPYGVCFSPVVAVAGKLYFTGVFGMMIDFFEKSCILE